MRRYGSGRKELILRGRPMAEIGAIEEARGEAENQRSVVQRPFRRESFGIHPARGRKFRKGESSPLHDGRMLRERAARGTLPVSRRGFLGRLRGPRQGSQTTSDLLKDLRGRIDSIVSLYGLVFRNESISDIRLDSYISSIVANVVESYSVDRASVRFRENTPSPEE